MRLRNSVRPNLILAADRLWPTRPVMRSPRRPLERKLLDDPGFRGEVKRLLDRSDWVGNLLGEAVAERLFDHNRRGVGIHEVTCGLLTLVALERGVGRERSV